MKKRVGKWLGMTDSMCFLKRYALKTAGKVAEIYVYKEGREGGIEMWKESERLDGGWVENIGSSV